MSTERNIDDLLKEDEARLKAKRKRLSTFGKALEDARAASVKAADTAAEILDAGDLTRADIAKVFALSKGRALDAHSGRAASRSVGVSGAVASTVGARRRPATLRLDQYRSVGLARSRDASDDRTRTEQCELDNESDHQNRENDKDDCHASGMVSPFSRDFVCEGFPR